MWLVSGEGVFVCVFVCVCASWDLPQLPHYFLFSSTVADDCRITRRLPQNLFPVRTSASPPRPQRLSSPSTCERCVWLRSCFSVRIEAYTSIKIVGNESEQSVTMEPYQVIQETVNQYRNNMHSDATHIIKEGQDTSLWRIDYVIVESAGGELITSSHSIIAEEVEEWGWPWGWIYVLDYMVIPPIRQHKKFGKGMVIHDGDRVKVITKVWPFRKRARA